MGNHHALDDAVEVVQDVGRVEELVVVLCFCQPPPEASWRVTGAVDRLVGDEDGSFLHAWESSAFRR